MPNYVHFHAYFCRRCMLSGFRSSSAYACYMKQLQDFTSAMGKLYNQ